MGVLDSRGLSGLGTQAWPNEQVGYGDTLERFSTRHAYGYEPSDDRSRASFTEKRFSLEKWQTGRSLSHPLPGGNLFFLDAKVGPSPLPTATASPESQQISPGGVINPIYRLSMVSWVLRLSVMVIGIWTV